MTWLKLILLGVGFVMLMGRAVTVATLARRNGQWWLLVIAVVFMVTATALTVFGVESIVRVEDEIGMALVCDPDCRELP